MTDKITSLTDKKAARAYFLELRKAISDNTRTELDAALISNAIAAPCFADAKILLCYYPVRGEPNILALAEHALNLGKTVAFPISHIDERRLSFHRISDMSELTKGAYGIPEPSADLPEITDFSDALCIVPALSFGKSGRRLGYGGGYYDRFLSTFSGVSAGLVYNDFYVEQLPTEPHDATVDIIITENGGYFSYE